MIKVTNLIKRNEVKIISVYDFENGSLIKCMLSRFALRQGAGEKVKQGVRIQLKGEGAEGRWRGGK